MKDMPLVLGRFMTISDAEEFMKDVETDWKSIIIVCTLQTWRVSGEFYDYFELRNFKENYMKNLISANQAKKFGFSKESIKNSRISKLEGTKKIRCYYEVSDLMNSLVELNQYLDYVKKSYSRDESLTSDEYDYVMNY